MNSRQIYCSRRNADLTQALARAVYSRLRNVVFDDTFSGLDAQNTRLIGERLFGRDGILRRTSTSVVLATHNRKYIIWLLM